MSRGNLLLVGSDRGLLDAIVGGDKSGEFDVQAVPTLAEARTAVDRVFDRRRVNILAFDLGLVPEAECLKLVEASGAGQRAAVFFIQPDSDPSPGRESSLRDLSWPLPAKFVDEVAAAGRPVIFLVDRPVFLARAVELSFKPTGVQPVVLQTVEGIVELLGQAPIPALKEKGFYGRLFDGFLGRGGTPQAAAPAGGPPGPAGLLGHVAAVLFEGGRDEAARLDADLRAKIPGAVCYRLSNADPVVEAGKALAKGGPVRLERAQARHIVPMLVCSNVGAFAPVKFPILLVDGDLGKLADLARALLADGYHVEMVKTGDEALALAASKGRFHVAVVGVSFSMSFSYAVDAAPELARKLHAADPDLRFVFMLDLYPLERSVREMSRLVELGADDVIIKPVEATRLVTAVDRAVKRRALVLEQARLGMASVAQAAFGQAGPTVSLIGGRYELVFQIGEGGMGVVFLATDRQLGRKVALKRMRADLQANAGHREKFIEEARLVSRLTHPYIVGVHDIVDHRGELYLVLDYVDGKPLSEVLHLKGRLKLEDCRRIMEQVCQGVDYAHRSNILHRDLKPANIMIDSNGYAKVMDFGLAREFEEAMTILTQREGGGRWPTWRRSSTSASAARLPTSTPSGSASTRCWPGNGPSRGRTSSPRRRGWSSCRSPSRPGCPRASTGCSPASSIPTPVAGSRTPWPCSRRSRICDGRAAASWPHCCEVHSVKEDPA
ncbi:MAG: protein kinase [Elusimicrobiota bacterium]|jgi:CheY-like chemotaxis protein